MSHSLTKLWIHAIFGVKNRKPLLNKELREKLIFHLLEKLEEINCKTRIINGAKDHLHLLLLLPNELSISQLMKNLKGESSHWINQTDFLDTKFSWQTGFGAFSISESNVKQVQRYIENQEEHHKKITFKEEYKRFMELHQLSINR